MKTYSILIPVYNGSKYIKRCLDSCVAQLREGDEVVVVNDGSSDDTFKILEEYAMFHPAVKVIHTTNQGVSTARNTALSKAKGEYVLFLDCDDCLKENVLVMLDTLLQNKSYDMLIGRVMERVSDRRELIYNLKQLSADLKAEEATVHFISDSDNLGIWAVWRHVYSRAFLKREKLMFNPMYSFGEDMDFLMQAVLAMKSYAIFDFPLCEWYIHEESVSGRYSFKSALSHLHVVSKWRCYFACGELKDKQKLIAYFANKQLAMLPHLSHLQEHEKERYFKEYNQCTSYLSKATGKFALVNLLGRCIGYRRVSKLWE